jgi:ferritin-like metal-binding protein YciE
MLTLRALFLEGVANQYDCELEIIRALAESAEEVGSTALVDLLRAYQRQEELNLQRLEGILKLLGHGPRVGYSEGFRGIAEQNFAKLTLFRGSVAGNASVVSSVRKAIHHQIASFESLHSWAITLHTVEAATKLESAVREQYKSLGVFSAFAVAHSNNEALDLVDVKSVDEAGVDKSRLVPSPD